MLLYVRLDLEKRSNRRHLSTVNHNNPLQHEADQFREALMQDRKNRNPLQWLDQYQASKTVLFWACAGSVIVAVVVGFSWGGWVTGGSAAKMADKAAAQARQELAAVVCVDRFMAAPDAGVQLSALQKITNSYQRSQFVQDGGWAIMPVSSSAAPSPAAVGMADRNAAGLCAEELTKRESQRPGESAQAEGEATETR
jgi:pimeloyl-ACP methyl ester carboxylesterase